MESNDSPEIPDREGKITHITSKRVIDCDTHNFTFEEGWEKMKLKEPGGRDWQRQILWQ